MKILFIGDIVGRPGRRAVLSGLNRLLVDEQIDLAIANCENAAAGFGVTGKIADHCSTRACTCLRPAITSGTSARCLPIWSMSPGCCGPTIIPTRPVAGCT